MCPRQPHIRPDWKESSERKVSPVEAAYVVESYLIEQNFSKTLTEFRNEAASIFATFGKGRPKAVKSLSKILHEYVVAREELTAAMEEISAHKCALEHEQAVCLQERNKMQILLQQIHKSLAVYQAGCNFSAQLPVLIPQTQQPVYSVPEAHPAPSRSQTASGLNHNHNAASARTTVAAGIKRKHPVVMKTMQRASLPENPIANVEEFAKKARRHIPIPENRDAPAQRPACGTVRKISINRVRHVESNSPPPHPFEIREMSPNFPNASPASKPPNSQFPEAKSSPSEAPAPTSEKLPRGTGPNPPRTASNCSSLAGTVEDSGNGEPQTPTPTSEHLPADNRCLTKDPHSVSQEEHAAIDSHKNLTKSSPDVKPEQVDLCSTSPNKHGGGSSPNKQGDGSNVSNGSIDTCGQVSPNSRTYARTRETKLSKTMRPLDFDSLPHSNVQDENVNHNVRQDTMPHFPADLEPIDDILGHVSDISLSEFISNMLDSEEAQEALANSDDDIDRSVNGEGFEFDCTPDRVDSLSKETAEAAC